MAYYNEYFVVFFKLLSFPQVQQDELRRRTYRRKLFVEQGERVAQRYPGSSEEISWRVNYLNNKWDQLESNLTPAKGRNQEVEVELGKNCSYIVER